MILKLVRTLFQSDGIFGHLETSSGIQIAVTLEHAYERDGDYLPKVFSGIYECKRGPHKLKGMTASFETFEIENVTNHTDILFHWGNYNKDSEGCVLLGRRIVMNPDKPQELMITSSRNSFNKFMDLTKGFEAFTLIVEDER